MADSEIEDLVGNGYSKSLWRPEWKYLMISMLKAWNVENCFGVEGKAGEELGKKPQQQVYKKL